MNISIPRTKLLSVPLDIDGNPTGFGFPPGVNPIGKPFYGISYGFDFRGVNPETGVYWFANSVGQTEEDIDLTSGVASMINTQPIFYGGISNSFSYKELSLDVLLQFTKQNGRNYLYEDSFLYPGRYLSNTYGNVPIDVLNRWQKIGDEALIQRFTQNGSNRTYDALLRVQNSNNGYVDASFIRLRNISLSYQIPSKWKMKLGVQSARFFLQGQNVFTLTKYKGLDPEVRNSFVLPQLRVYSMGVQLGL